MNSYLLPIGDIARKIFAKPYAKYKSGLSRDTCKNRRYHRNF
jgi:hypothetical protein